MRRRTVFQNELSAHSINDRDGVRLRNELLRQEGIMITDIQAEKLIR